MTVDKLNYIMHLTDILEKGEGGKPLRRRWMKVNFRLNRVYKTGKLIRRLTGNKKIFKLSK